MTRRRSGTLALVGGSEWGDAGHELLAHLVATAPRPSVVVLPTAAAFGNVARLEADVTKHLGALGAQVTVLPVLHRAEAEDLELAATVRAAAMLYLTDGSPLHLRSVLKGAAVFDALVEAHRGGATLVASGAGATVLCDPMVDPRGGAYTVGLGVVSDLAVFPYHGTAAEHLRERSVELLPRGATLAGIDEATALVRAGDGTWTVMGAGAVTLYRSGTTQRLMPGSVVEGLPAA